MYALIQLRAQPTHRARIIAANNTALHRMKLFTARAVNPARPSFA
jgi:hypothetical protein